MRSEGVIWFNVVGWLSGREAEYMETLSDEEVSKAVVSTLKKFLKKQKRDWPKLRRMIRYVNCEQDRAKSEEWHRLIACCGVLSVNGRAAACITVNATDCQRR